MSATFASPVAAVLLAVELLLFEWKPRSVVPVALASATAAAARRTLLGLGPLFPVAAHPAVIGAAGLAGCVVAGVLAGLYLMYDLAVERGTDLPGGDLRLLALAMYIGLVLLVGSLVTYLIVPRPGGSGPARRSGWSAALGFFAAVPIAYLVLVVALQVIRPLIA